MFKPVVVKSKATKKYNPATQSTNSKKDGFKGKAS